MVSLFLKQLQITSSQIHTNARPQCQWHFHVVCFFLCRLVVFTEFSFNFCCVLLFLLTVKHKMFLRIFPDCLAFPSESIFFQCKLWCCNLGGLHKMEYLKFDVYHSNIFFSTPDKFEILGPILTQSKLQKNHMLRFSWHSSWNSGNSKTVC